MARIEDCGSLLEYSGPAWHHRTYNPQTAMIEVKNRHIVLIGRASSGLAASLLLHQQGASVFVTDHKAIEDAVKSKLASYGIPFEEKGHTPKAAKGDFAVLSPGVPTEAPIVQHYLDDNKEVYSEIEAASWYNKS